jgi:hypothetical protein
MVVTRKKRRENKEISIYLNNKPLEQVKNIKYLGIVLDSKLNFREHTMHITGKWNKLIHELAKSAKLGWGLNHEALHTTYKGAILPLMLYGALIWIGAMGKKCNKILYSRVQRLMNIKIAKAYRTTSNEALCILTGTTSIELKAEEAASLYRITREKQNHQLDHELEPKDWIHPADSVKINEQTEVNERTIHIFTDGSKNGHGVGSGTATHIQNKLIHQMKHKIHERCSNNQAEQMALVQALQARDNKNKQKRPKNNNNTHRQQDNPGLPQKQEKS